MSKSISIVIVLLLISTISSEIQDCMIKYTYYRINSSVHNCLKSLNYYKQSTLDYLEDQMVTVQTLYDLAIIDLNEVKSHNFSLLNKNNGYGCPKDDILCNCESCAGLSDFTINEQLEFGIMEKLRLTEYPEALMVYETYRTNPDDGRVEMCTLLQIAPEIMEVVHLNSNELKYIVKLCNILIK